MRMRLERSWLGSVLTRELLFFLEVVLSNMLVYSGGQGNELIKIRWQFSCGQIISASPLGGDLSRRRHIQ